MCTCALKVVVLDWPLNKDVCNILQSYTAACVSVSTSKLDFKTKNFHGSQWGFLICLP